VSDSDSPVSIAPDGAPWPGRTDEPWPSNPWPGNADVEWDTFDSDAYFKHNYDNLRDDDADIIRTVADFFQSAGPSNPWRSRAIDVGSGANLYPALTMLPFCSTVTLYERAFSNRQWLTRELSEPHGSWWRFWDAINSGRSEYARIIKPLDTLRSRAEVVKGSVFALEPARYDIGTMFFVAESITKRVDEFRRATRRFLDSLVPRAPFAAAFMQDSAGYWVGDQFFPACSINERDIRQCLADVARIAAVRPVESHGLREGYGGMIVATGWKR
jgi:hypothetical protein